MKLFQTGNIEVVRLAQRMFGFALPSFLIEKRSDKFYMLSSGSFTAVYLYCLLISYCFYNYLVNKYFHYQSVLSVI